MSGGQINIIPRGPCKAIEKILLEISNEMTEVIIAKLNIEDSNSLNTPTKYGIVVEFLRCCFSETEKSLQQK